MDARLRISRQSGWGRYRIVVDGRSVGVIARGQSVALEVASGSHTLHLDYRLGLASPVETFSVQAGETAAFSCHPPSLIAAVPRLAALLLRRGSWIALDRPGRHEEDGSSPEQQRDLIGQIQAAQANQPGVRR